MHLHCHQRQVLKLPSQAAPEAKASSTGGLFSRLGFGRKKKANTAVGTTITEDPYLQALNSLKVTIAIKKASYENEKILIPQQLLALELQVGAEINRWNSDLESGKEKIKTTLNTNQNAFINNINAGIDKIATDTQKELYDSLKKIITDHTLWTDQVQYKPIGGKSIKIANNGKSEIVIVPTGIASMARCLAIGTTQLDKEKKDRLHFNIFPNIANVNTRTPDAKEIINEIKELRKIAIERLGTKSKEETSPVISFYESLALIKEEDLNDPIKLRGY